MMMGVYGDQATTTAKAGQITDVGKSPPPTIRSIVYPLTWSFIAWEIQINCLRWLILAIRQDSLREVVKRPPSFLSYGVFFYELVITVNFQ